MSQFRDLPLLLLCLCLLDSAFSAIGRKKRAIVNGEDAPARPFYVRLFAEFDIGTRLCGGVIINTQAVLTAGHCTIGDTYFKFPFSPTEKWPFSGAKNMSVQVGDFSEADSPKETISIKKWVLHENYNDTTLINDIALLLLDGKVGKDLVIPLCNKSYADHSLAVCGMGRLDPKKGGRPQVLQEVILQELDKKQCPANPFEWWNRQAQVCAGVTTRDRNACQGDSGGPLFPLDGGVPQCVYGLVSYGHDDCRTYVIFTRVSAYIDWIKQLLP